MTNVYSELANRIRGEIAELTRLVELTRQRWLTGKTYPAQQDVYLESVALNLHSFYSGLERLFELTAKHLDRSLPTGEAWHRDLLQQMATDKLQHRPAILSQDSADTLDEFRRFRHLIRNVYTFNLVPAKMERLVLVLPAMWSQ
ncbi:MAG: hypothetical protein KDE56_30445 [Anaerolineales bacterium]|nr:hypothetical protein [Anaerolineales bacterium]